MDIKYKFGEVIGNGRFSKVYKATDCMSGATVAVKVIVFGSDGKHIGVPSSITREISLLKELDQHENIVRLLDVLLDENRAFLVFEYFDYNLDEFMGEYPTKAKDPRVQKSFLRQILLGVAYCHSHKIIHRDLKPENLLVDHRNNIVKLADFGLSREVDVSLKKYTEEVATIRYMAPEILFECGQYSFPMDIWSVGCIFGRMVRNEMAKSCRALFPGYSQKDQLKEIFSVMGTPDEKSWPGVTTLYPDIHDESYSFPPTDLAKRVPGLEPTGVGLLSKMLQMDPSKRITAEVALKHEYFEDWEIS